MSTSDHFVEFFDNDDRLVESVTHFVQEGIAADEVCVVIATAGHRTAIERRLLVGSLDLAALVSAYRYIAVDADTLLSEFFTGAGVNRERFHDRVGLLLKQAAASGRKVRLYGELVALLMQQGEHAAVLEVEEMWNEHSRLHDFVLYCGYPKSAFKSVFTANPSASSDGVTTFGHVCALHTRVHGKLAPSARRVSPA